MSVADGRSKGVVGGAGVAPPPDAPQETAQPIQPGTLSFQQAQAAANEKPLPPFNPQGRRPIPAVSAVPVKAPSTASLIADVFGSEAPQPAAPRQPLESVLDPDQGLIDQLEDILPELTPEDRARMPAASNSDSPSRGILASLKPPMGDKFEGISRGGFSDGGEAQYFPLDGTELRALVLTMLHEVALRIENDLRFSIAVTYPRVRATISIEIEGHAEDNNAGFMIEKVVAPKDGAKGSTPLEMAKRFGDEVCFVVSATKQEFTPEGEIDSPPDAMRDHVGLSKPRKQMIETSTGPVFVDVAPGTDARALTR